MNRTHGHTKKGGPQSPTYRSWMALKTRCTNPNHKDYGKYKETWYPPWQRFGAFLNDMGERPEGTSIDRIDGDKPYSPENCRWATAKVQTRNRKMTVLCEQVAEDIRRYRGLGYSIKEIHQETGVRVSNINNVLYRGDWS